MSRPNTITVISILCVLVFSAFAQHKRQSPDQMPSFSVGPMVIEISGRPGQSINRSISLVTRNYNRPQSFTVHKNDLSQSGTTQITPVDIGLGHKSCAGWIDISSEVIAKQNDRIDIPFTVTIPRDQNLKGQYFAFIDVTTNPKRPPGQFAVLVKYKLPVKIELTIPGEAPMRLDAKELTYKSGRGRQASRLTLKIKNEGEWKTSVTGDIILRKQGSVEQRVVPIPYAATTGKAIEIYPKSEVSIDCEMDDPLSAGSYTASVRMLMNQFGRSLAHFELNAGEGSTAIANLSSKEEYDLDLGVSPYLIEVPLRPGAVRFLNIRVKNNNKVPIQLDVGLHQADMELNGSYTFSDDDVSGIKQILKYEGDDYNLQPYQASAIRAKIEIPQEFKFSNHSAYALKISANPAQANANKEWLSRGEFTVPILIYDAAAKDAKLECTKFEIVKPGQDLNPTTGIIRIKNKEGKIAKVRGRISLRSESGREYAYMDIGRLQPELIMSGSEREFRFEMPTLDEGQFTLSAELKLEDKNNQNDVALFEEKSFVAVAERPQGLR